MGLRDIAIVLLFVGTLSVDLFDGRPRQLISSPAHFLLHALLPEHNQVRDLTCLECRTAAGVISAMMAEGATVEEIEDQVILDCILLDLFPPDVCSGMVQLSGAEVLHVLNKTKYDHETVCGWLLGGHCQHTQLDPWTLSVPGAKPEPFHPEPVQPTDHVVRILQLSDLHVDLLYDEGSAAYCDHPNCCRHAFGNPAPGEVAAGHWGTLANCDIPLHTLDDLLAHAALTNPHLVYVTGDLPPHDVWAQDHATNLLAINTTVQLIAKHFPDVPVIHALGNHASAPVNSFVVPAAYADGWNMDWLYDSLAEMWAPWVPEDALPDVRKGGYFSFSPKPGLRVVSANMNYCNTLNCFPCNYSIVSASVVMYFAPAIPPGEYTRVSLCRHEGEAAPRDGVALEGLLLTPSLEGGPTTCSLPGKRPILPLRGRVSAADSL